MRKRLFINSPQPLNWRVRIRRRLKIREKVIALAVPHSHALDALIDLAKNTRPRQPAARAETAIVAKRAAARCHRAVHIGASKSGIDADLLYASAKTLPQEEVA
jgi:hypothetical protein